MEIIRATRLDPNKTILDLKIGGIYAASYRNRQFYLNENIKAKSLQEYKPGELRAVRIKKIDIPDNVIVDVINQEFVIVQDNTLATRQEEAVPDKVKPEKDNFTWDHKDLELMKQSFIKTATVIRNAIYSNTPIIIRHHSDGDGYSAGIALERAIKPLVVKEHHDYSYRYYNRSSSKPPYYDYLDASKDIENSRNNTRRFGSKPPLIILADLGSGEENVVSLNMVKLLGASIVIIDHHHPGEVKDGKSAVCKYAKAHLNPFLQGLGSGWASGLLCYELAHFINKDVEQIELVPGIAAIADKTDKYDMKVYDQYVSLAKKAGLEEDYLNKLVRVIDFEAQNVKWLEVPSIMDDLYGYDKQVQKDFVELIFHVIEKKHAEYKQVIKKYAAVEEKEGYRIVRIDLEKISFQSEYPNPGRITALCHEMHEAEKGIITIGRLNGMLIFRADKVSTFSVNELLALLQKNLPHALISGGGHAAAGSFKYLPAAEEEVLAGVKKYLGSI